MIFEQVPISIARLGQQPIKLSFQETDPIKEWHKFKGDLILHTSIIDTTNPLPFSLKKIRLSANGE